MFAEQRDSQTLHQVNTHRSATEREQLLVSLFCTRIMHIQINMEKTMINCIFYKKKLWYAQLSQIQARKGTEVHIQRDRERGRMEMSE